MVALLLRIAARRARRHFHLSIVAAPISSQYFRTPAAASAVQRSFSSDSSHSPPGERRRLKIYHDKADQALLEERDLQRLMGRHSKGEAAVLPLIVEEIVFRRIVRMLKRFKTNTGPGMGYYFAIGPTTYGDGDKGERELMPGEEVVQTSDEMAIGPTRHADEEKGERKLMPGEEEILPTSDEIVLEPQLKRVIFYLKAIENEPTEKLGWEEDSELKDNFREVKPKCYDILPMSLKRTLMKVAVELGDMCARCEMKGEDAYGLLKHFSEDREEDRSEDWDRYYMMYSV